MGLDTRKIIHIDMDAFYASVEMKDNPELVRKPVIVGGSPKSRGVVCAANYQARKFGIHSAMPCSTAYRKCPEAVFIRPRFDRYKEVSSQIHTIFSKYTDQIEALALDEAWLDVTSNRIKEPSASKIADIIRSDVFQKTGLTCSAGVSYNKFLAKVATEENKPNGLFVIPPQQAHAFLMNLPIQKISGVGPVTANKLASYGISRGIELFAKEKDWLEKHFGKFGNQLYQTIRGIDNRPVVSSREPKSISIERTFPEDMDHQEIIQNKLEPLTDLLWERIEKKEKRGRTFHLKVKFYDFQQTTRNVSMDQPIDSKEAILKLAARKLQEVYQQHSTKNKIRLIGIGVSGFQESENALKGQLNFLQMIS